MMTRVIHNKYYYSVEKSGNNQKKDATVIKHMNKVLEKKVLFNQH